MNLPTIVVICVLVQQQTIIVKAVATYDTHIYRALPEESVISCRHHDRSSWMPNNLNVFKGGQDAASLMPWLVHASKKNPLNERRHNPDIKIKTSSHVNRKQPTHSK